MEIVRFIFVPGGGGGGWLLLLWCKNVLCHPKLQKENHFFCVCVCVKTHTNFCARFSSKPVIMQTKTIQFLLFLQLKKMRGKAQPLVHHMCFQVYRSRTDFRTGKIIRKQMILLTEKICRSTSFFYNPISDTGYTFLCF